MDVEGGFRGTVAMTWRWWPSRGLYDKAAGAPVVRAMEDDNWVGW